MSYRLWHRVLVHTLTGRDDAGLGEQERVEIAVIDAMVAQRRDEILTCWHDRLDCGQPWPVPPTGELSDGLPWGQWATTVHQLRARHGLLGTPTVTDRVTPSDDPQTRALMADRPPHW